VWETRSQRTKSLSPATARNRPLLPKNCAEVTRPHSEATKTCRRALVAESYIGTNDPAATAMRDASLDHDAWLGNSERYRNEDRGTQKSANSG